MAISENRRLTGVRLDNEANEVVASWITELVRDSAVINQRLDHVHYGPDQAAALAADVPNGVALVAVMGW